MQSVFEFIRLSAVDPDNIDSLRESYWIIVYLYLKRMGYDISESFSNEKTKSMLQGVNAYEYNFSKSFLIHEPT